MSFLLPVKIMSMEAILRVWFSLMNGEFSP